METKNSIIFQNEDQINENLNTHMSRLDVLYNMEQGFTAKDREIYGDNDIFISLTESNINFKDRLNGELLRKFIKDELVEGKYEFRIAIQNDNHIIIHPFGKDGKTLDLYI